MNMRKVYLDNAATTVLNGEVLQAMMPYFTSIYGNSHSQHTFGRDAVNGVDNARDIIAKSIGASSNEVFFTCGGTEANNWALRGVAYANISKGKHIITSSIEHHSVLDTCKQLEKEGFTVTYLPVDNSGLVSISDLLHEIKPETTIVSIMAVNNEVGTIQNIKAISEIVKFYGACFHVDGVQALGVMPINVNDLGIDLLSISAHKIHGPKGAGALYIRKGVKIDKFMIGGEQEMNRRGGTVNVPAVVGFGKACELNNRDMAFRDKKLFEISQYFIKKIEYEVPDIIINGNQNQKVNNIVSVTFLGIEGEYLVTLLDMKGIAVSTGSACASGSFQKSHVLKAMGRTDQEVRGTIRFSFDVSTTKEDVDYVVRTLCEEVEKLRKDSPVKYKKKDS
ncbi:MAG: cysteine desulfurase [Clostridiales bacterium]|nr:cysteine desulfurase [Clostridiales bacterium]